MQDLVSRLYEQGVDELRIEMDVRRSWQWVKGGVDGLVDLLGFGQLPAKAV